MRLSQSEDLVDRFTVARRVLWALAMLLLDASCTTDTPTTLVGKPTDAALSAGLIVSDPVWDTSSATRDVAAGSTSAFALPLSLSYVSMPPGTIADGVTATIRNRRTGSEVATLLVDGGFDPQPIQARVGDTLDIAVGRATSSPRSVFMTVVPRKPPRVVRTIPPRDRVDVPINLTITVVFSEPVAAPSVNATSVRLMGGSSPVAGTVRIVPGSAYTVEFSPAAPLAPGVAHTLTVERTITDLSGDALDSAVTIPFTTALTGSSVASVVIEPGTGLVLNAGSTIQLTAHVQDASYNVLAGATVTWSSTDPVVASVSASGLVTAVDGGSVTITAESEGKRGIAPVTVLPRPNGKLTASTVTKGVDLDPDGYLVALSLARPKRVGLSGSITLDSLYSGVQRVWLADIEPNCAAIDESPEVDIPSKGATSVAFTVTCGPRSAIGDDPLAGVWRAERFEFFRDSVRSSRLVDMIAAGVTGTLIIRRTSETLIRWEWRETYPFWGPDRPTLNGGSARVVGGILQSVVERWAGEPLECDGGACEGALPGLQAFVRNGDQLVFTGLQPTDAGYFVSRKAWARLTLSKVR